MKDYLNEYIELTRIKRPIGFMLLFWPCSWGLSYGYDFNKGLNLFLIYLILFFLGSVLMRSAGCIINDIADRRYDILVERTKMRPIASGKITVFSGLIFSAILCMLALLVLLQFNNFTILLALISMPLAFTYPYMKRITYWPQLFLGITFNYGLILGWTATNGEINLAPVIFYLGAIFWTLGYDTIYGFQDIKDDEIIGVKSTSIKFKFNPKFFLTICYLIFFITLLITGLIKEMNIFYFLILIIIATHLFLIQITKFRSDDPKSCLKIFKSNNLLGFLVMINVLIGKF